MMLLQQQIHTQHGRIVGHIVLYMVHVVKGRLATSSPRNSSCSIGAGFLFSFVSFSLANHQSTTTPYSSLTAP